jgi:hypothetical protein
VGTRDDGLLEPALARPMQLAAASDIDEDAFADWIRHHSAPVSSPPAKR